MNYHALLHSPVIPAPAVDLIEKARHLDAPVLILGERGTAKELVAKIIHHTGAWERYPFYRINCRLAPALAFQDQLGRISKGVRQGSIRGTLFLKEIGNIDRPGQAKLLDLMEAGVFTVGMEARPGPAIRLICSSSEDLRAKTAQGNFLGTLYERIAALSIPVTPLRERSQDIASLAAYLFNQHPGNRKARNPGISSSALKLLESYPWPENLREFSRVMLRSAAAVQGDELTPEHFLSGLESDRKSFWAFAKKSLGEQPLEIERARQDEPNAPLLPVFFIELVHRIRNPLVSIKTFTQLLRDKFDETEYREYFYRIVTEDIEKIDSVLNGLLEYIKISTPARKANTVHLLLEEILKKNENAFAERRVKVFRKLERDLPETMAHEEQLRYILETLLCYALESIVPEGSIGFLTKSIDGPSADGGRSGPVKEDRWIEILIVFTGYRASAERFGTVLGTPLRGDEPIDLELRLVKETVEKNRGVMKLQVNDTKTRTLISIRLPMERRKVIYYPGSDANRPFTRSR
jgi:signal transduction histidine kinase